MTCTKPLAVYDWDACPSGTLQHLSEQIIATKQKQKQRQALRRGGALAVLLVVMIGSWNINSWSAVSNAPSDVNHGGISCTEVQASLAQYTAGHLPVSVNEQIVEHMRLCPRCAAKFREMHAGPAQDVNTGSSLEQLARSRSSLPPKRRLPATNLMLALQQ